MMQNLCKDSILCSFLCFQILVTIVDLCVCSVFVFRQQVYTLNVQRTPYLHYYRALGILLIKMIIVFLIHCVVMLFIIHEFSADDILMDEIDNNYSLTRLHR